MDDLTWRTKCTHKGARHTHADTPSISSSHPSATRRPCSHPARPYITPPRVTVFVVAAGGPLKEKEHLRSRLPPDPPRDWKRQRLPAMAVPLVLVGLPLGLLFLLSRLIVNTT
jgi:hypothetical protein